MPLSLIVSERMQNLKADKRILIVSVAAICLILLIGLVFLLNTSFSPSANPMPNPTASPTPLPTNHPATNVKLATSEYMRTVSNFETKIYLLSAIPSYGYYPEDVLQQITNVTVVHKGDPCFILNLTVRNDYTYNDTVPGTANSVGTNGTHAVYLILGATLFDNNGNKINATDITNPQVPFLNRNEFGLANGETDRIDIVLATPIRNIDHFEVNVWYMGALPMP
jgi:hypothetical protein